MVIRIEADIKQVDSNNNVTTAKTFFTYDLNDPQDEACASVRLYKLFGLLDSMAVPAGSRFIIIKES